MIYIGIDVAKNKHDCFITNSDGEILFKPFTIPNNLEGFDDLYHKIESTTNDPSQVKVGLEATGHYNYNLLGYGQSFFLLSHLVGYGYHRCRTRY